MRHISAALLALLLLAACGKGGAAKPAEQPTGPTSAPAAQAATEPAAPTDVKPTPDNSVATVTPATGDVLNDSFATAKILNGDPIKSSVKESLLYYKVAIPQGAIITGTVTVDPGSPSGLKLSIYNEHQDYLTQVSIDPGKTGSANYTFNSTSGKSAYFSVEGTSVFSIQAAVQPQNDAGSGKDAGEEYDHAVPIKSGSLVGVLANEDQTDILSVELPKSGGVINLTIATNKLTESNVKLSIYNSSTDYIANVSAMGTDTAPAELHAFIANGDGGKWYLRLEGVGPYSITEQFTAENDGESKQDAPGDQAKALPVSIKAFDGALGGPDATDAYRITGSSGHTISFTRTSKAGNAKVSIYSTNGDYIAGGETQNDTAKIEVKDTGTADYILLVESSDEVTYHVEITP